MKHFLPALALSVCSLAAQPAPGTGVIEGHVWNLVTGAPLKKATVRLTANDIHLEAATESDGHFVFSGLPAGTYRLSGSRPGFLDRPARRPATIAQDGHVSDAEIRLPPQGSISGKVLDADGDPLMNGRILIFRQVYRGGRKQIVEANMVSQTNEDGEYHVAGLKPGRYLVEVYNPRPRGNSHYGEVAQPGKPVMFEAATYYPNTADQQSASVIEVGAGADVRGIDIRMAMIAADTSPRYRVQGKVTGMSDLRLNVNVTFNSIDRRYSNSGFAMPPDDAFQTTLPAGQYTYLAYDPSGQATFGSGTLTVTGDVSGIVVAMSPPPEVPARVLVSGTGAEMKLRGVRVDVYSSEYPHSVFERTTDAAGKFEMPKPLRPGNHYSIEVRPDSIPDGCYFQAVTLAGREINPDDFEITGSAPLEIVLARNAGKIAGSAVDDDGKPLLNAAVTLYSSDGSSPRKLAVSDDGSFAFPALRPGKYVLLAWEELNEDLWEDPVYRKKFESRATEITIGPNETQSAQVKVIAASEMK